MKYYAVTEDPNELLHYGRLGMKWGKHIFGDRSEGYKKAFKKLKSMTVKSISKGATTAKAAVSAVKRNAAIASENREIKRERKYQNAVAKAQRRMDLIAGLHQYDQERAYAKELAKDQKIQAAADKAYMKEARKEARFERHMPKAIQQAREGTLKYKKLSDEQVQRITDRLALESQARRLGSTEEPSWRQQKKAAYRQGKLQGITRGTSAAMEEIARAGAQWGIHAINRSKLKSKAKHEGEQNRVRNRAQNKKTARDMRNEIKQEAYEAEIRSGAGFWDRGMGKHMSVAGAARRIQKYDDQAHQRKLERDIKDQQETWKITDEHDINKRIAQKEADMDFKGKLAYEYGFLEQMPNNSKKKKNGGGNNQGNITDGSNNNQNNKSDKKLYDDEVKRWAKYYEQKKIRGLTNQEIKDKKAMDIYDETVRLNKEQQKKDKAREKQYKAAAVNQQMLANMYGVRTASIGNDSQLIIHQPQSDSTALSTRRRRSDKYNTNRRSNRNNG